MLVGQQRLWWSDRVSIPAHLMRGVAMASAAGNGGGLGLDTRQYNAHTTATDLLWGGTPYITMAGDAFAARVAASLAISHGVPGLLVHSAKEYEDIATQLSGAPSNTHFRHNQGNRTAQLLVKTASGGSQWHPASPTQFRWLQLRVEAGRQDAPLFNLRSFVSALETRLRIAWRRALAGGMPVPTRQLLASINQS